MKIFVMQFEDFANHNAFDLLAKYGTTHLVFNDDIQVRRHSPIRHVPPIPTLIFIIMAIFGFYSLQGTAAVVLAGVVAALKLLGGTLADNTFLCFGAGEVCFMR